MKADDREALRTRIWYTADGRDIQIRQMHEEHIINCIHLIIDRAKMGRRWRFRYLRLLDEELVRRGKQAIALKLINDHTNIIARSSPDLNTVDDVDLKDVWGNS